MERPIGPEVGIWDLIPGEQYYAFSTKRGSGAQFRGTFTGYYMNEVGYDMLRFHYTTYKDSTGYTFYTGSPEKHPKGSYWRIFDERGSIPQSYNYYKLSSLTQKEKKELATRVVLRERRQIERGLTGSTDKGMWIPRDLVREISLKYLTDPKVGCAGRWR